MEEKKVSVIIPVYNTAQWLPDCLESVIGQDYENLQIICINDGSTDETPRILESYAAKDRRILIIDQANHGAGYARNQGLERANGDYVLFVDSDDKLMDGIIRKMAVRAEKDGLDFLRCSGETIFDTEELSKRFSKFRFQHDYPGTFSGLSLFSEWYKNREFTAAPYRTLYRRPFLERFGIRFPNLMNYEDELWTYQVCLFAECCGVLPETGYIRRYRDGSLMTKPVTIEDVSCYYQTFIYMTQLCYDHRVKVKCYPEFTNYPNIVLKSASRIYKTHSSEINGQARDDLDRAMLRELELVPLPGTPRKITQSELEKQKAEMTAEHDRQMREVSKKLSEEIQKRAVLEKQNGVLKRSERQLRNALSDVYRSSSWKVGNFIVRPFHSIRKKLKRLIVNKKGRS